MKNCIDFKELLSAYYDGELTKAEAAQVEEHIKSCYACSALLEIYKEFSDVTDSTNVPVPDALRIGVMNQIRAEKPHGVSAQEKRKRHIHIALTRYMPLAACLVVVLFVWSFWGNVFNKSDNADPQGKEYMLGSIFMDASDDGSGGNSPGGAGAGGNSPGADGIPTGPAPEEAPYPDLNCENEQYGIPKILLPWVQADSQQPGLEDDLLPSSQWSQRELSELDDYINGAAYWIAFKGELPAYLIDYKPAEYSSRFNSQEIYEIPSLDVHIVLNQLSDRKIFAEGNDKAEKSSYAIVVYFLDE